MSKALGGIEVKNVGYLLLDFEVLSEIFSLLILFWSIFSSHTMQHQSSPAPTLK